MNQTLLHVSAEAIRKTLEKKSQNYYDHKMSSLTLKSANALPKTSFFRRPAS